MFDWIRSKVKNLILAGVNDAVAELVSQGANNHEMAGETLREQIRLLPAPEVEEPRQQRRKNG